MYSISMTPEPDKGIETGPETPAGPVPTVQQVREPEPDQGETPFPTSLNDELTEKLRDNPNRFIGCGG